MDRVMVLMDGAHRQIQRWYMFQGVVEVEVGRLPLIITVVVAVVAGNLDCEFRSQWWQGTAIRLR